MYRFKNWLNPPTFEGDLDKAVTANLLNSILLTLAAGPIFFSIAAILIQANPTRSLAINITALILFVILLILLRKGFVKAAATGTIIITFLLFAFVASLHSGVSSPVFSGLIPVVMIAGLLLGKRSAYLTAFFGVCLGLLLLNLYEAELIPFANSLTLPEISTWVILSVFLGISAVFVSMSRSMTNKALSEAEQHLIKQQDAQNALRISEKKLRIKNEELERSSKEMETLRQSATIVASTLDQQQTISLILEQLERVVPYTSASVQLIREDELEIVGGRGVPEESGVIGTRYPINENTPDLAVIQGRQPYVLFDDIQTGHVEFQRPPHNYIHSWISVPLKVKDQIFGVITVDGNRVGQFALRDAQLVSVFADQVAIALENARLYSALQDELTVSEDLVIELEGKNAELERFTYTVSHDLKSPLITIRGFLGYLEKDAIDGNIERLTNDIERISKAAGKMGQLLDELLELSRIGRLMNEPEEISFETVVREAVGLVEGQIKDSNIKVKIGSDLPKVYGDRTRLVEVVQNLVDNAVKFTKDQPNPKIEIGVRDDNGDTIFYVKDNGIGIDPKYHKKIFGLFDKLDPGSDGTGVGLALVKRIVEVHGGRIWVESEPGKGATFCFTLAKN